MMMDEHFVICDIIISLVIFNPLLQILPKSYIKIQNN